MRPFPLQTVVGDSHRLGSEPRGPSFAASAQVEQGMGQPRQDLAHSSTGSSHSCTDQAIVVQQLQGLERLEASLDRRLAAVGVDIRDARNCADKLMPQRCRQRDSQPHGDTRAVGGPTAEAE